MSGTETTSAPVDQAPPSPAPSNPPAQAETETADVPAATEEKATNGDSNGDVDMPAAEDKDADAKPDQAPKSSRTSARNKAAGSPKAQPAPKSSSTPKPSKPRTSSGGPPKKAASGGADKGNKEFKVGDIVLARLKGYPAWPARIADPDNLPRKVAASRPNKSPSVFCAQYFPVGDFSWLNVRDLTHLSQSEISEWLAEPHRKASGGLREAYQTAQDPTEWDEGQQQLLAQQNEVDDNEDELEDEEEEEAEDAGAGGKRKKAGSKGVAKKKAKTEKEDAPKTKSKAAAKPKSSAPKSKAPESKPAVENQAPADDDPLANNPECVKVKEWRHRLQRAFLGKSLPDAEEMTTYDDLFKSIEEYKDMTIDALQYSKIGKVMKKIAAMDNIPKNDEYKITDRAQTLMGNWHNFIEKNSPEDSKKVNGDGETA